MKFYYWSFQNKDAYYFDAYLSMSFLFIFLFPFKYMCIHIFMYFHGILFSLLEYLSFPRSPSGHILFFPDDSATLASQVVDAFCSDVRSTVLVSSNFMNT